MKTLSRLATTVSFGFALAESGCATPLPTMAGTDDTGERSTGSTGNSESAADTRAESESTETGDIDPVCGNGIIEADEECDDEGESATCDPDCTVAECSDGTINATAGEECDDEGESVACNANCTVATCGDGITNMSAGEGCDDEGESVSCDVDCTPAECGDGLINATASEECDDTDRTAACDADCTLAECGDGTLNPMAVEECDDGGESTTCDADCTAAICGDGVINMTAMEQCDDGGESALCDVDCTPATCGDGVFNATAGEQCDDAGPSAACDGDCTLAGCGDGIVNVAAGEQCDDAGESAACNSNCTVAVCGDGITNVTAGEACDDMGNSLGCDGDCTVPACGDGYTNPATGEICDDAGESASCDPDCTPPVCGDGIINALAGEECEGPDLGGSTCVDVGFDGGTLACTLGCNYSLGQCLDIPPPPVLQLAFSQVKQFDFTWMAAVDADYYQLEESVAPGEPFVQLGTDVIGASVSHTMPLHFRREASYRLLACNAVGCSQSAVVDVVGSLADSVGYFKAFNSGPGDEFGWRVSLSGDGSTLAVGAPHENSNAIGIGGDESDNSATNSGAVYVFGQNGAGEWVQEAYIKASNTDPHDRFGYGVALSENGNTLAIGAPQEDSNATGVGGNEANNSSTQSGAAYIYSQNGAGTWSQQAYIKASNTDPSDGFGYSVALSADGITLAVGAHREDSNATGVGGNEVSNSATFSGAAYVYSQNGAGTWSQQAYIKASNTGAQDNFGHSIALSGDGDILAVGSVFEDSNATGTEGDETNNLSVNSGAVYIYSRDGAETWSQEAYVKASNTNADDEFGHSVTLSGDGSTMAVGTYREDSNSTAIGGDETDNSSSGSGAAYIYTRDETGTWTQEEYIKASNAESDDYFGFSLALSDDGSTLAVGAYREGSDATGIGGDESDNSAGPSGAAYIYSRNGAGVWTQEEYVKASNTDSTDFFGHSVALSENGNLLAVGARYEDSNATGLGGDQTNSAAVNSGAVYLY